MKNNAAMEDHWSNNPRFACRHNWHFVQGLTARLRCTRCGIMTWPKDAEQKVQEVLQDAQTDRELMQQALDALTAYDGTNGASQRKRVLAALRERLAQPEQEPVLYVDPNLDRVCTDKKLAAKYGLYIPLYAKPQSAAKGDNS